MGPSAAASPPRNVHIDLADSSAQQAQRGGQNGSVSPRNSSKSATCGQPWPLKCATCAADTAKPAPEPLAHGAPDSARQASADNDCSTPGSDLSFRAWADRQPLLGSPLCDSVTAPAAPPPPQPGGAAAETPAQAGAHDGSLQNGTAAAVGHEEHAQRPQPAAQPACGTARAADAPAVAACQPDAAGAAAQAKPAKRPGREDHLS